MADSGTRTDRRTGTSVASDTVSALAALWRDTATPVLLLDVRGLVAFANRAFERRIGRAEAEMLGRPAPELFLTLEAPTPGADPPLPDPITGRRLRLVRLNPRGGTPSTALCASQPIDDASGQLVGVLLLFSQHEPSTSELSALVGTLGADLRTAARALRVPERAQAAPAPRESLPDAPAREPTMSVREREVLGLLVSGRTVQAIADELRISPNTVRNHVRAIYRKLGVRSQLELLARVYRET